MPLSKSDKLKIIRWVRAKPRDVSLSEIGAKYGVSWQYIWTILNDAGIRKPTKLGKAYTCRVCGALFRGTKAYGGSKAKYCDSCREKRGK